MHPIWYNKNKIVNLPKYGVEYAHGSMYIPKQTE